MRFACLLLLPVILSCKSLSNQSGVKAESVADMDAVEDYLANDPQWLKLKIFLESIPLQVFANKLSADKAGMERCVAALNTKIKGSTPDYTLAMKLRDVFKNLPKRNLKSSVDFGMTVNVEYNGTEARLGFDCEVGRAVDGNDKKDLFGMIDRQIELLKTLGSLRLANVLLEKGSATEGLATLYQIEAEVFSKKVQPSLKPLSEKQYALGNAYDAKHPGCSALIMTYISHEDYNLRIRESKKCHFVFAFILNPATKDPTLSTMIDRILDLDVEDVERIISSKKFLAKPIEFEPFEEKMP